jgi:hypothetical protein
VPKPHQICMFLCFLFFYFPNLFFSNFCHFGYIMNKLQDCTCPNTDKFRIDRQRLLGISSSHLLTNGVAKESTFVTYDWNKEHYFKSPPYWLNLLRMPLRSRRIIAFGVGDSPYPNFENWK